MYHIGDNFILKEDNGCHYKIRVVATDRHLELLHKKKRLWRILWNKVYNNSITTGKITTNPVLQLKTFLKEHRPGVPYLNTTCSFKNIT